MLGRRGPSAGEARTSRSSPRFKHILDRPGALAATSTRHSLAGCRSQAPIVMLERQGGPLEWVRYLDAAWPVQVMDPSRVADYGSLEVGAAPRGIAFYT